MSHGRAVEKPGQGGDFHRKTDKLKGVTGIKKRSKKALKTCRSHRHSFDA
jgi:hypothetical protein